jgi:hypothetical protein
MRAWTRRRNKQQLLPRPQQPKLQFQLPSQRLQPIKRELSSERDKRMKTPRLKTTSRLQQEEQEFLLEDLEIHHKPRK